MIGSVDDIDFDDYKNNKSTLAGYYAAIVQRYKEISPDAKFFFMTLARGSYDQYREKIEAFRQVQYDLAERFDNSYVIDIYKYGPEYGDGFKKKFYMHGHLSPAGYIFTAQLIDSYIDYIVRTNPDDFKTVGFIGTNIKYKFDE